jgi:TPP-dependent trihydroxycyclohexane-1,2-dione (THcHDO) dehydratase
VSASALERAELPLVIVGRGMAWGQAEDEVRAFIERTQDPFLRSPTGKGVMPDEHPLAVSAARTLALQNADVVFLMGARFNWIFHFVQPPRYAKDMQVIQLDIAPEDRLWQGDPRPCGDRAIERRTRRRAVVPSEGHAVALDDHEEGGGERGTDPAADPR